MKKGLGLGLGLEISLGLDLGLEEKSCFWSWSCGKSLDNIFSRP